MKKISGIADGVGLCETLVLINNVALIESANGKSGLFNIKSNSLIGKLDDYRTIYDKNKMLYIQVKKKEDTDDICEYFYLRIYDASSSTLISGITTILLPSKIGKLDRLQVALKCPMYSKSFLFW